MDNEPTATAGNFQEGPFLFIFRRTAANLKSRFASLSRCFPTNGSNGHCVFCSKYLINHLWES